VKLPALGITLLFLAGPGAAFAADLRETYQSLQQAVAHKDAVLVKKLAVEIRPMITEALAAPAPQADDQKEAWTGQIEWAKSAEVYADYALYATAIVSPPAAMVDLLATLENTSPKSKYLDQAYSAYFYALSQTGGSAKIPAIAEKASANFPENEDILLILTDAAATRKQNDRALESIRVECGRDYHVRVEDQP